MPQRASRYRCDGVEHMQNEYITLEDHRHITGPPEGKRDGKRQEQESIWDIKKDSEIADMNCAVFR